MEKDLEELLDYERLKAWTEGKKPGDIIGTACTNTLCPLANYLHEQTDKLWSVGPWIKTMDGTRMRIDIPAWVQGLIDRVDGEADAHDSMPVTREDFLRYLEEVKPQ